jgi:hypothetical protein
LPWGRGAGFERVVGIFGREHHVDRLTQQLPPTLRRIKSACDLAGFKQIAAVIGIGAPVRALGPGKEIAQRMIFLIYLR